MTLLLSERSRCSSSCVTRARSTLPDEIRRAVRLAEGDYLAVSVRGDAIVLEPKAVVDASQAWFWQRDWQAGEREASAPAGHP